MGALHLMFFPIESIKYVEQYCLHHNNKKCDDTISNKNFYNKHYAGITNIRFCYQQNEIE